MALEPSQSSANHTPILFGIGCFHFGVAADPPISFTGGEFLDELHRVLVSAANVSNVVFRHPWEALRRAKFELAADDEIPRMGRGHRVFPRLDFAEISFDLYIAETAQASLYDPGLGWKPVAGEHFSVRINYLFRAPVAFVSTKDQQATQGSHGVILIREFLKKLCADNSSLITLDVLGPSPFHCDFDLRPNDPSEHWQGDPIFSSIEKHPGYDDMHFLYDTTQLASSDAALDSLIDRADPELDFFYTILNDRAALYREWTALNGVTDRLVDMEQAGGFGGYLRRLVKARGVLNAAFIGIARFEEQNIYTNASLQQGIRDLYPGESSWFEPFVTRELDDFPTFATPQLAALFALFESRRATSIQNLALLLSAVVGVIVGAALATLT